MSKPFRLLGCGLFLIFWFSGLLAACGEDTPTSLPSPTPAASPTPSTTQTVAPVPATAALPTATSLQLTPVSTATPLPPVPTLAATGRANGSPTGRPPKVDPVVGDLPAPPQGRKLNLTLDMLQRLQKKLIGKPATTDLSGLTVGAYATTGQPVDVFDYYRSLMPPKGWTESHKYDNRFGIYFEKGSQVAIVSAIGIPDDTTITFLAGFIPEVKGQLKGGEVLVLLGQGPPSVFEMLIK